MKKNLLTTKKKLRASLGALPVVPDEALVHAPVVAGHPVHHQSEGVRQVHLAVEVGLKRHPVPQPLDLTHGGSGHAAVEYGSVSGVGHLEVVFDSYLRRVLNYKFM